MRNYCSFVLILLASSLIASCGGGGSSPPPAPTPTPDTEFSIGGTVSGVGGTSEDSSIQVVSLRLESSSVTEQLSAISTNGNFSFNGKLPSGEQFTVSILSNSTEIYCSIISGTSSGAMPANNINNINVECLNRNFEIYGYIEASAINVVDTDINDPLANYLDNSSFANAQDVINPLILQGFLSAEPTNIDGDLFSNIADTDDFFYLPMTAGQIISLQVVDFNTITQGGDNEGDLDLVLYDDKQVLVSVSDSEGEFDVITVPEDGDYYINVTAFSGKSSYLLTVSDSAAAPAGISQSLDFLPGQALVKMSEDFVPQAQKSVAVSNLTLSHSDHSRASLARFNTASTVRLHSRTMQSAGDTSSLSFSKLETLRHIKRLSQTAEIEYVEPNYIRKPALVPNDTLFDNQTWNYSAMNLPQAWDITTGTPASGEVIVAVVDNGIFLAHEELDGVLIPGYDFVSELEFSLDGDGIDDNPNDPGATEAPGTSSWHGTQVAGIIGAKTNNAMGIAGVSWGVKIMPIRVTGDIGGSLYDILQGIRYAAGLENDSGLLPPVPAHIINISLGSPNSASLIGEELFKEIFEMGIIVVTSAGNENSDSPSFPAAYASVLSVSAVNSSNQKTGYSNFGVTIDIAAPGGDFSRDISPPGPVGDGILTTFVHEDFTGLQESSFAFSSGTSISAPHVSGMIALMKAVYPQLTASDVRSLLLDGQLTKDIGELGFDEVYGFGLADALKAVQAASNLKAGNPLPDSPPPLLKVSPSEIDMGTESLFAYASVSNRGGGSPTIVDIQHDNYWLFAFKAEGNGPSGIQFYVDRRGLPIAEYSEEVTIFFDTGDELKVQVSMTIDELDTSGQLGKTYGVLVDPNSNNADGISTSSFVFDYDQHSSYFSFDYVRPGDYLIYIGSDIDNDGLICEVGENCGAYPSLANPELVKAGEGIEESFSDFTLEIITSPLTLPGNLGGIEK